MGNDGTQVIDAAFVDQVAEALRHLHDPSALMRSPLSEWLAPTETVAERRGRFLRTALLKAIEALNPGPKVPFRSAASRSYDALRLHYIEGQTIEEVAKELAVSERQAYRDIRKGEADAAEWLKSLRQAPPAEAAPSLGHSLRREVERLPLSPAELPLRGAVAAAIAAVEPLAGQLGVTLRLAPGQDVVALADAGGLRQTLMALLSYALQCGSREVTLEVALAASGSISGGAGEGGTATVCVRWPPAAKSDLMAPPDLLATARTLAQAIGAEIKVEARPCPAVWLRLPTPPSATVLVVDDNEGLLQLFQRYLVETGWRVIGAASASEGLQLARTASPRAIVLDILMPGMDGWAFLASLKSDPATASVPVIVCSVFNDPRLAKALGAASFLAKPVSRSALLAALARL